MAADTSYVTAIDPGSRSRGWARFVDGRLEACGLGYCHLQGLVIIENPQVYRGGKVDPNDLLVLARDVGRVEQMAIDAGLRVELVHPRTWKGNVPKTVHQRRILAALDANERAMVEGKKHDVVDAVGLGLWKVGRLC